MSFLNKFINDIKLFNYLNKYLSSTIVIAVSGGPDSMTLLDLSRKWAINNQIKIIAITINHNLRKESYLESKLVKEYADKYGIEFHELKWVHGKISGNILAKARNARYELLTKFSHDRDILNIFTAHQKNDYIENFFIRVLHGSGILGLTNQYTNFYNNVRILRPLYNFSKQDCIKYVRTEKIDFCEDRSNNDVKYLRVRTRKYLSSIENLERITNTQTHIGNISNIIKDGLIKLIASSTYISPTGYAIIKKNILLSSNIELQTLLISHLLSVIGNQEKNFPRLSIVKNILNRYGRYTAHGCIIYHNDNEIILYREFGKKYPNDVLVRNNNIWDSRFKCFFKGTDVITKLKIQLNELIITYLTHTDYKNIKEFLKLDELYKNANTEYIKILFTLPVIRYSKNLVAIPSVRYYINKKVKRLFKNHINLIFYPQIISRLVHL